MHQHRHLFERICSLENLIAAGKAALRGKRTRLPGAAFLADFEKEVSWLHDELWAGTYRHDRSDHPATGAGPSARGQRHDRRRPGHWRQQLHRRPVDNPSRLQRPDEL